MSFGSSTAGGRIDATVGDGSRELGKLKCDGVGLEEVLRLEDRSGNEDDEGGRSIGDEGGTGSSSVSSPVPIDVEPTDGTMRGASTTGIVAARAITRWKFEEAGSGGKRFSAGTCACCRHAA